ncbi:hypothetical protein N431DRAFT_500209 [Stipitochalara longipes BDJ]|nr:hypothetical protein N431DRAFT_500209 [Stipitochalara longipes BDJ]
MPLLPGLHSDFLVPGRSPSVQNIPGTAGSPSYPASDEAKTPDHQNSASTACISCREKHLKCDGLRKCTRCSAQGIACVYLKSRRGCRGRGKHMYSSNSSSFHDPNIPSSVAPMPPTLEAATSSSLDFIPASSSTDSSEIYFGTIRPNYRQRCLDSFYHYFYDAHPFLPPRHYLLQVFKTTSMQHLQAAMCYVGSRFVSGASTKSFSLEFESYLQGTKSALKDASMVQAMLLFALGLDGNNEQKRSIEVLNKAQDLALELRMNMREYAFINGRASPMYEESLRRTWWELYVVGIMMAGFHGVETFHHWDPLSDMPLPCEEKEYESGFIPPLRGMEQFDHESFDTDDEAWSSYAYRIAAARNMERVLQSEEILFPKDPALYRLEAYLTNWHLHLPDNKRDLYDQFGAFDEMLFQAHMIANMSTMLLYRHFSPLDGLAVRTITSCIEGPHIPVKSKSVDNLHTIRTIQAASHISKLVTLPGPLVNHTHFFVCALTLSSITHLSLWATLPVLSPDQDLRERIRMNAGALKAIAPFYPSAEVGLRQMTNVAQKIFANRKDAVGEVFWGEFIEGDFMSGMTETHSKES